MHIRPLTLSDIPALLEMSVEEEGFKVSDTAPCFWAPEQLERWISVGEDVLLGAEVDGRLVGFVLTTLHRPTGKVTWENQRVLPEFRGQGIAESLKIEMKAQLRERGGTYMCALVRTDNPDSVRYYANRGMNRGHDFVWFEEAL